MSHSHIQRQRLGILIGGGPASGINGVIGAATIAAIQQGLEVIGINDGFKWLSRGDISHTRSLTVADIDRVRFRGGSLLHTSRENPTKDAAKMAAVLDALRTLAIRYLVTIGGDDTAFSAYYVSQQAAGAITVAHVPKTIDNDLPLPAGMPTFGFHTARHVGAGLVSGLLEDARATHRWYIVVAMGRTAGHLALGMGQAAGATLTLIPEEYPDGLLSLELLCDTIEGSIIKSAVEGRDYGVVVVAEGIADLLKEELKDHPLVVVKHDDHGHFRLAEVPFALILKRLLQARAEARDDSTTFVDVTLGYELRCPDPIPYDIDYTHQLGWGAVRYLLELGERRWGTTGALISVQAGEVVPIPFADILDVATGRTAVRRVNILSDSYACRRAFMTRLERRDFDDAERLETLASAAGISTEAFRARFAAVVGLEESAPA